MVVFYLELQVFLICLTDLKVEVFILLLVVIQLLLHELLEDFCLQVYVNRIGLRLLALLHNLLLALLIQLSDFLVFPNLLVLLRATLHVLRSHQLRKRPLTALTRHNYLSQIKVLCLDLQESGFGLRGRHTLLKYRLREIDFLVCAQRQIGAL